MRWERWGKGGASNRGRQEESVEEASGDRVPAVRRGCRQSLLQLLSHRGQRRAIADLSRVPRHRSRVRVREFALRGWEEEGRTFVANEAVEIPTVTRPRAAPIGSASLLAVAIEARCGAAFRSLKTSPAHHRARVRKHPPSPCGGSSRARPLNARNTPKRARADSLTGVLLRIRRWKTPEAVGGSCAIN